MKNLKSFKSFVDENTKTMVFTFGRFNPPTIGHGKLFDLLEKTAKSVKGDYRIYPSRSGPDGNPKSAKSQKNPLKPDDKIKFMRQMFGGGHARKIIDDKSMNHIHPIAANIYEDGYTKIIMIVGPGEVDGFSGILKPYNNKEGKWFYNFPDGIEVRSAGERDPEAEGVEGMSSTKMKDWVRNDDYENFKKGLPNGFGQAQELYNAIRVGLGFEPRTNFREHIDLNPDPLRDQYLNEEIFKIGDIVTNKKDNKDYKIIERFTNYVQAESTKDKKQKKIFVHDLKNREVGTDEYRDYVISMTPYEDGNWVQKKR